MNCTFCGKRIYSNPNSANWDMGSPPTIYYDGTTNYCEGHRKMYIKARVQVVLDIPVKDSWGAECAFKQVKEQATQSALDALKDNTNPNRLINGATIVGEPLVTAIMMSEAK